MAYMDYMYLGARSPIKAIKLNHLLISLVHPTQNLG